MYYPARMGSHVRTSPITHTFRTRTARIAAVAPRLLSTTTAVREPHPSESFLSGTNAVYAEEMYREWKQDPSRCVAAGLWLRGEVGCCFRHDGVWWAVVVVSSTAPVG